MTDATPWPPTCCGWLVRHGESQGNKEGRVQGQAPGIGLSPLGEEQIAALAAGLEEPGAPTIGAIVTSDLDRCRRTANAVAQVAGIEPTVDARLRERSFGELEGRSWSDVGTEAVGITDAIVTDPQLRPPGGESVDDVARRIAGALRDITSAQQGPVVVVTHGGPIRVTTRLQATVGDLAALDSMPWQSVPHAAPMPFCMGDHR